MTTRLGVARSARGRRLWAVALALLFMLSPLLVGANAQNTQLATSTPAPMGADGSGAVTPFPFVATAAGIGGPAVIDATANDSLVVSEFNDNSVPTDSQGNTYTLVVYYIAFGSLWNTTATDSGLDTITTTTFGAVVYEFANGQMLSWPGYPTTSGTGTEPDYPAPLSVPSILVVTAVANAASCPTDGGSAWLLSCPIIYAGVFHAATFVQNVSAMVTPEADVNTTGSVFSFSWFEVPTTVPNIPDATAAAGRSATAGVLTWTNPGWGPQLVNDTVRWGTTPQAWTHVTTTAGVVQEWNITGLAAATVYFVSVEAWSAAGPSGWSPVAPFTTLSLVVLPPILSAVSTGPTTVALAWTAGQNITAANYTLETGNVLGGPYGTHVSLGASTFYFTETGLTPSTLYYFIVVEWTSVPTTFTSNSVAVETSAAASVLAFTGTTEIANGGGAASSSGGVTVSAYNEATCAIIPTVSSCVLDGAVSSNASGTWALYGLTPATYYLVAGTTPASGPEEFGGATLQETYSTSTVRGISLEGSPFVDYGNATFVLPNFACYGQYQAKTGGVHDCQTPVLAWTQDGAFYVNSASNLVFYSFINASVTVIHPWTLLNQTFASYNMVPNQLFATQDGSYIYGWGTLVAGYHAGDSLTFEAVNVTTHRFFEYNFTGVTEASVHTNGQVLMTGWDGNDSTVVLTIATGAMFYYNIWTGVQTSGQTLDYFEANNVYWVPFLNGFVDVHAGGSTVDNAEEWQLSSGISPTLTKTFANTWGPGTCVVNGANGVIYNVTAHLLYFSGGSAACGNNFVTYHVTPTTGTMTAPATVVNTPSASPYNGVLLGVNAASDRNALMSEGPLTMAYQRGFFNYSVLFSPTTGVFKATDATPGVWNEVLKAYSMEQFYQEGQFFNASYFIQELSTGCSQGLGSLASICSVNTSGYASGTVWYDWQMGDSEFPNPSTAAIAQPVAPAAPTVVATEQTFASDRVAWVAGGGSNPVVNWSVFYTVNGSSPTHLNLWAQNTSVTLGDLPLRSVVAYCVQEWNLHWESACTSGSISNDQPPPVQTAPVLSAAATGTETASLSWTAPQNFSVANYEIYLGTSYALAMAFGDRIATESASTFAYSVTALQTNTSYWLVVAAVASSSATLASNVVPVQTWQNNQRVIGTPILSVVAVSWDGVNATWTAVVNATIVNYTVVWEDYLGTFSYSAGISFSYDIVGLPSNATVYVRVLSWTGVLTEGPESNAALAHTTALTPKIVMAPVMTATSFSFSSSGDNYAYLNWSAPVNWTTVNYTVLWAPIDAWPIWSGAQSNGLLQNAEEYQLPCMTYVYEVQAWNSAGHYIVSNPVPVTSGGCAGPPAPPSDWLYAVLGVGVLVLVVGAVFFIRRRGQESEDY